MCYLIDKSHNHKQYNLANLVYKVGALPTLFNLHNFLREVFRNKEVEALTS